MPRLFAPGALVCYIIILLEKITEQNLSLREIFFQNFL